MKLITLLALLVNPQASDGTVVHFGELKWPSSSSGVSSTVAEGNPQKGGTFTIMQRLRNGVWVPPHFHNHEKRLIVIRGELLLGRGTRVDPARVVRLTQGAVVVMPANTPHYEGANGETIVAVISNGPFNTVLASDR